MAARTHFGGITWQAWPDDLKFRQPEAMLHFREKLAMEIEFHGVCSFSFSGNGKKVRRYAGKKGVAIIGDMPLYVGGDSADVWANTGYVSSDDDLHPTQGWRGTARLFQ
jgi:4-alpha-glucanotransferase